MSSTILRQSPPEHTTVLFRLLTVALASSALAVAEQPLAGKDLPLCVSYLATSLAVFLVARRYSHPALIALGLVVDVGFVTAIGLLGPFSTLPYWVLYLFPIAAGAAAGRQAAAAAVILSVVGYYASLYFSKGALSVGDAWAVLVLGAATLPMTILSTRWLAESREKRAWRELAAAMRALAGKSGEDEVAEVVAERARALARAGSAWIWWCDDGNWIFPGPVVGKALDGAALFGKLEPELRRQLERGPVPLTSLGRAFAGQHGGVVALCRGNVVAALLGVRWGKPAADTASRLERLRVYTPWAAAALTEAHERSALAEELRFEQILRQVAVDLATTVDRDAALRVVVEAARQGLAAEACVSDLSSGKAIGGDVELAETLLQLTSDEKAKTSGEKAKPSRDDAALTQRDTPLAAAIDGHLALLAWRASPKLGSGEKARLEQLAALAREALARCARHEVRADRVRLLEASLDGGPAPLAVWDKEGKLVFSNHARRALGFEDSPPGGLPPAGGRDVEINVGDPNRVFVAQTADILDGRYVVAVYREITRERASLRWKDELISVTGHELRGPLTSILGYSQIMSRELGVVQRQVNQLNRLVGDFMDAAQMGDGHLPLDCQVVELGEAARGAAERFSGAFEGRRLRLEVECPLPVLADPSRLRQIFDNLLGNAAKYSPPEEEITLALKRFSDSLATIVVSDRGIGIAPEDLPRVFDRFYRARNKDTAKVAGSGLGLAIVRELVAAHGGTVRADSPGPGLGSTFVVTLPMAPLVEQPPTPPPDAPDNRNLDPEDAPSPPRASHPDAAPVGPRPPGLSQGA